MCVLVIYINPGFHSSMAIAPLAEPRQPRHIFTCVYFLVEVLEMARRLGGCCLHCTIASSISDLFCSVVPVALLPHLKNLKKKNVPRPLFPGPAGTGVFTALRSMDLNLLFLQKESWAFPPASPQPYVGDSEQGYLPSLDFSCPDHQPCSVTSPCFCILLDHRPPLS